MSAPAPHRPVSRPRMLFGAVVLFALLAGVVATAELLRHPPAAGPSLPAPDAGDVREEVECVDLVPPQRGAPAPAALPVSSADVHDCPSVYDQRVVIYEGEAVGALLERRDGAWIQLNDDAYGGALTPLPAHRDFRGANSGVGVFLPPELVELVDTVGGPRAHGDTLRVTGTFHRVDPASGEVGVIRASQAVLVTPGTTTDQQPLRARRIMGVLLALIAAAMTVSSRRWPAPSQR